MADISRASRRRLESCGCPLRRCLSPRLRNCTGVLPLDSIWLNSESAVVRIGEIMIAIGIILLIIGFLTKIPIVWTIGIIVVVLGLIALLLGTTGHAIGGRRHYW